MTEGRRKTNPWPLFIVLLAGCFLALSAWSVHKAANESSPPLVRQVTGHK